MNPSAPRGSYNGRPPGYGGPPHPEGWEATGFQNAANDRYRVQDRGDQIRQVFDLILRGRWVILGALLFVAIPVAIYSYLLPNQYRAYSLLRVEAKEGSSLEDLFTTGASVGIGRASDRFLSNEMLVLRQSLLLGERTAQRLIDLAVVPETGEPLSILYAENGAPYSERFVALRLQSQYLTVAPEGSQVDAIRISAKSTVPGEASLLANVYAEEYMRRSRETSRASVSASREFLEDQVAKRFGELEVLDDSVRQFMSREGAIALDEESQFFVRQVSELEALRDETAVELQLRRATLDATSQELDAIRPNLAQRLASGVDQNLTAALEQKAELEIRLQTIYLRNPSLRDGSATGAGVDATALADLESQLTEVRRRILQLSDEYVQQTLAVGGMNDAENALAQVAQLQRAVVTGRIEISGLEARRQVLDQRIREYEQQLQRIPRQAIELAQLQRARQSAEQTYLMLVTKLQELRVAEESELGYAEVIRPALVPAVPFSPNRVRNIVLGVLMGLGLGIVLAILKTRLDNRIHRPDDLRDLGHTVIGVIPNMEADVKRDFGGAETITQDGQAFDTRLMTLLNPIGTISEAYRGLRTNVQFARPDTVIQTMLITSASPSEGKSVTAANLAVVMAQAGRRVVLVDADLRRPTVHKKFGLPKEPGLSDLLFDQTQFDPAKLATGVENLYVITAGARAPNPAELLGSKKMRETIDLLRGEFDLVLFDVPPVLAATDAVLLSTQCDAVMLVATAGQTKTYEVDFALSGLRNVGAQVIGTMLNRFDASKAYGYGYRYRYGYSNYYGYNYAPSTDEQKTTHA